MALEIGLAILGFAIGYLLARVWKLGERVERLEADNMVLQKQTELLTKRVTKLEADNMVLQKQTELLTKRIGQKLEQITADMRPGDFSRSPGRFFVFPPKITKEVITMPLELDYYYGNEAEQYNFYRIPKALLTDHHYKSVSLEAKVLYGLMLDRMGLSVRNGWLDSDGRVYIYFTQEDAMAMLSCGKDKATKLFRELDGIGLIERRKQGQGRPTRIYVKNFILPPGPGQAPEPGPSVPSLSMPEGSQTAENQQSEAETLADAALQTAVFPQSGPLEKRSQECGFSASNKTEKKKTKRNDTDLSILPPILSAMRHFTMSSNAHGVCSAALWKSTMYPGFTRLVTLL